MPERCFTCVTGFRPPRLRVDVNVSGILFRNPQMFITMKKTIIIAASLLTFISCTKSSNNSSSNSGNNNPTPTSDLNTVTIIDNGSTYTQKGGGTSSPSALENILCTLSKETSASSLKLYIVGTTKYPVQMQLTLNEAGPVSGTGVYALADTPTTYSHYYQGTVTETFSGGQTYNIDTSYVSITTASNNTVIGTFRLHVTNASGGKVITGNINCKAATVN